MATQARNWAVVGGGVLGMFLAHRLARRGERVTLFEAAPTLGGLASEWSLGDITWDRHYHVTLRTDTHLLSLLEELGLAPELRWTRTRTGFYTGGRFHSVSSALEFLRFPGLGPLDKVRLGFTLLHAARTRDWRRLEDLRVEDWLRGLSGDHTVDQVWLPLLRSKLGENYRRVSAAFIWATIQRLYGARSAGVGAESFGYVRGGYARVLERFASELRQGGVTLRTGCALRRVESMDGGLRLLGEGGDETSFDRAVLTLPAPLVARLCPGLPETERAAFEGIEYQGIVCASVLLRRRLAGYYVTNITDAGFPFTAVIEMTALVDPAAFGGRTLVYLPKYVAAGDPAITATDEEIRIAFLGGLARMVPDLVLEDVLAFRVSRVRHVFPLPTLGFSRHLPPMRTSVPGLFAVNSSHIVNGTLNVNETIRLGERALELLS